MRTLSVVLASALVAALFSGDVLAQKGAKKLYRWTDDKGEVHYTDHLPPEAAKAARDQLNANGMAVDSVDRARTPEEQVAYDADQARAADAARQAEEKAKLDAVLISSYPAEADLQRAYNERFDLIARSVESTGAGIASQEKSLTDMLAHAAGLEREGKPIPDSVITSIGRTREQVTTQREFLSKRAADKAALDAEFEAVLARYRELVASRSVGASSDKP